MMLRTVFHMHMVARRHDFRYDQSNYIRASRKLNTGVTLLDIT